MYRPLFRNSHKGGGNQKIKGGGKSIMIELFGHECKRGARLDLNEPLMYLYYSFLFLQSEPDGFALFHVYVCAALLVHFSKRIRAKKEFQVCPA